MIGRCPRSQEGRRVAVLIVCHNRREKTVRALRSLGRANAPWRIEVVLFDDGSTDRTAEAVREVWPDAIIMRGKGDAYWNRGLYEAWMAALRLPVDAFLWLNDDVELDPDAITKMEQTWVALESRQGNRQFILVGATRDRTGATTYGGYRREASPFALSFRLVEPGQGLARIDTFNGNLVLVPQEVVERIGINDPSYFHSMGDIDYGLRAKAAGTGLFLVPGTLGLCAANRLKSDGAFGGPRSTLHERWKRANSYLGLPPRSWWRLTRRHSGIWFPLHFLSPYRRLFQGRWRQSAQANASG